MTEHSTRDAAACARALAALQGVTLDDADAALCGRLLAAVPGIMAAAAPDGPLFDVPLGAHPALIATLIAGERA
ncbi:hypothetical protein [Azospirillum isscasi]|uniref:Uncharacterized protein n=1 Tax=Azospirillum isscasi TaxID=3053926 RepID=A0ABU0WE15_9PROT|nr:hypothetical protein [Azospirillum isscasi]MDQ2102438.1 hypothetical protein [Azospirillum isscasi]